MCQRLDGASLLPALPGNCSGRTPGGLQGSLMRETEQVHVHSRYEGAMEH